MPTPEGTFTAKSEDFHLQEYACLRKEIELVLKDYRALERNIVIAVGVSWGWLYDKKTPSWMFCIPILFAVLGSVRAMGVVETFRTLHRYLLEIEDAFKKPDGPEGWEHFHKNKTGFSRGAVAFWVIIILATLGVAVFFFFHPL